MRLSLNLLTLSFNLSALGLKETFKMLMSQSIDCVSAHLELLSGLTARNID